MSSIVDCPLKVETLELVEVSTARVVSALVVVVLMVLFPTLLTVVPGVVMIVCLLSGVPFAPMVLSVGLVLELVLLLASATV